MRGVRMATKRETFGDEQKKMKIKCLMCAVSLPMDLTEY